MTFRIDRQPDGLMEPKRRDDGTLFVHARVARPGIYEYREDGETVRELVPREELYDPESLKSLGRVPYTDGHPGEPVEPENVSDHQVGDVGDEVEVDDQGFVKVKIAVRQKDAIRNVLDETKEETSPGYHCDALEESGEHPEFGEFDRIQTHRRYNHVAGVEKARGGPSIRMRTDSADHDILHGYRTDMHAEVRATREAMRLARELADIDEQQIVEQVADRIGASRSDALNMLRGTLEPTRAFLRAFAQVVGFDEALLLQAKSKDAEARQEATEDAEPPPSNESSSSPHTSEESSMPKYNVRAADLQSLITKAASDDRPRSKVIGAIEESTPREPSTINDIINGDVATVPAEVARGIADGLDANVEDFGDPIESNDDTQEGDMDTDPQELIDELKQTLSQFNADEADDKEDAPEVELPDEVEQTFQDAQSMLEELMPALEQMKSQKEALEAKIEKLRGKIETLTGSAGAEPTEGTSESSSAETSGSTGGPAPEDADEPSLDGEPREDADGGIQFDSVDDFQAYQQERQELEQVAENFRVDVGSAGTNLAIKRRIVEDATDKDLEDASREKIEGMYEGLELKSDHNSANYDRAARQTGNALESAGTSGEADAQADYDQRWKNG